MTNPVRITILLILCFSGFSASTQDSVDTKRLWWVGGSMAVTQVTATVALNEVWYKNHPRSSFHFFNDNAEWLQMDKAGHVYSVYQISRLANEGFLWTGMKHSKSAIWGATAGLISISTFEVLDGFSEAWGFSWGDMAANTLGGALFLSQALWLDEQRISIKFSASPSDLAQYRPNLLGNTFSEKLLKDYNGQTYWLSFTPTAQNYEGIFPKWISISGGYGAYGMIGGTENYDVFCNGDPHCLQLERYRRYYLSLDVDWMRIRTRRKGVKALFFVLQSIKIPFPALEVSQSKLRMRAVAF